MYSGVACATSPQPTVDQPRSGYTLVLEGLMTTFYMTDVRWRWTEGWVVSCACVCVCGVAWYLDVPGGPGGGVGAPQRARDAPRSPHADCPPRAPQPLSSSHSTLRAVSVSCPALTTASRARCKSEWIQAELRAHPASLLRGARLTLQL